MEEVNESLADRLNREVSSDEGTSENIDSTSKESKLNSDVDIVNLKENTEHDKSKSVCNAENGKSDNVDVLTLPEKTADTFTDSSKSPGVTDGDSDSYNTVTVDKITEIRDDGDTDKENNSGAEAYQAKDENAVDSKGDNPGVEISQTNADNSADSKGDNEDEFVDMSEDSGSDAEYESAEEGEEIQVDKENLQELENALTDEEKEKRRNSAQELKEEGNELFRNGSFKSAIKMYSRALRTCPLKYARDRSIMYSNRGACKMRLEDFEESIRDCSKALDLHPHYLKALMRRAELYEKTDKLDEALADYQKILELDPSQHTARAACMKLPEQIKERNEKLKEEMMSKLKDLGNMVLRPFGLSTNNFQMKQDPSSGGYSVNFVQNPEQK